MKQLSKRKTLYYKILNTKETSKGKAGEQTYMNYIKNKN